MTPEEIKEKLDRIITIDGRGRSVKATLLLELLDNRVIRNDIDEIKKALKEFQLLKY